MLDTLEGIVLRFGSILGIIDKGHDYDRDGEMIREYRDYVVGKSNGALSTVTLELNKPAYGNFRKTTVINVAGHEPGQLLNALHEFYSGRKGYRGPELQTIKTF